MPVVTLVKLTLELTLGFSMSEGAVFRVNHEEGKKMTDTSPM